MKRLLTSICGLALCTAAWAQNNISLPAGTSMKVKLETTISTSTSKSGDPFSGRLMEAVTLDGKAVIPVGATVQGRVTQATEPRRIAGRPTIGIFPEALVMPNGDHFVLNAMLVDTNIRSGTDVNDEGQFKGKGHDGNGPDRNRRGHGRRNAGRRTDRWGERTGDWWRDRSDCDRHPLAVKEELSAVARRDRAYYGVEPTAGDDGGSRRRTVEAQFCVVADSKRDVRLER